jgi:hypothetical protein
MILWKLLQKSRKTLTNWYSQSFGAGDTGRTAFTETLLRAYPGYQYLE